MLAVLVGLSACDKKSPAEPGAAVTTPSSSAGLNPQTVNETIAGSVSDADPICGAAVFTTPCKRHAFTVHHDGMIAASVTWSGGADIDLQLWRGFVLLEQSAGSDPIEQVSAAATAGESYELRVVYFSGTTVTNYSLVVSRPN